MEDLPVIPTSCEGCGVCCMGIGSPVVLYASRPHYATPHPFRPKDLPEDLVDEINVHFSGLLRGQEPQETCLWFDLQTRLCKHHEYRPQVCRDYEIGGRECLRERREAVLAGDQYPLRNRGETLCQQATTDASTGTDDFSSRFSGGSGSGSAS
ncbi:MAG: YkgJ family cysteine cluster protein [Planctomycetota bacterium]